MPAGIRGVLFDYSGVMTTSFNVNIEALDVDPAQLGEAMLASLTASGDHPWARLERGEIPLTEWMAYAEEQVPNCAPLFDPASPHCVMAGLKVLDERIDLVRSLGARGFATGLVTNNVAEWAPMWRTQLPDGLFDVIIDSSQVGCRKPDAEIYEMGCEALSVTPAQALFIDDFEWNVEGARAAGLSAVHCTSDIDLDAAVEEALSAAG